MVCHLFFHLKTNFIEYFKKGKFILQNSYSYSSLIDSKLSLLFNIFLLYFSSASSNVIP